jgi:hypothetical protein
MQREIWEINKKSLREVWERKEKKIGITWKKIIELDWKSKNALWVKNKRLKENN